MEQVADEARDASSKVLDEDLRMEALEKAMEAINRGVDCPLLDEDASGVHRYFYGMYWKRWRQRLRQEGAARARLVPITDLGENASPDHVRSSNDQKFEEYRRSGYWTRIEELLAHTGFEDFESLMNEFWNRLSAQVKQEHHFEFLRILFKERLSVAEAAKRVGMKYGAASAYFSRFLRGLTKDRGDNPKDGRDGRRSTDPKSKQTRKQRKGKRGE